MFIWSTQKLYTVYLCIYYIVIYNRNVCMDFSLISLVSWWHPICNYNIICVFSFIYKTNYTTINHWLFLEICPGLSVFYSGVCENVSKGSACGVMHDGTKKNGFILDKLGVQKIQSPFFYIHPFVFPQLSCKDNNCN